MDYDNIKDFLNKFKEHISKNEEVYKTIINVIEKKTKIKIDHGEVKIKGNNILILKSPIIKNEILINKKGILNEISKEIPQNNFIDIR